MIRSFHDNEDRPLNCPICHGPVMQVLPDFCRCHGCGWQGQVADAREYRIEETTDE